MTVTNNKGVVSASPGSTGEKMDERMILACHDVGILACPIREVHRIG